MVEPFLFVLTVVTILGTPGPTNTLLATAGAAAGVRRSLLLVPAELGGYLTSILIVSGLLHYSGCVPLDLRENEVKACSCMGLRRF